MAVVHSNINTVTLTQYTCFLQGPVLGAVVLPLVSSGVVCLGSTVPREYWQQPGHVLIPSFPAKLLDTNASHVMGTVACHHQFI